MIEVSALDGGYHKWQAPMRIADGMQVLQISNADAAHDQPPTSQALAGPHKNAFQFGHMS
jgi:hypothetical protein